MRTLICTYGYRDDKIIKAMRTIAHDELVLVTGKDNTQRPEYDKIIGLAKKFSTPFETVVVDIFDFMSCFVCIDKIVRKRQSEDQAVVINISGGLSLLSDAAVMAAFNNGCEAYYVDEVVRKMPVMLPILKVRFEERLTAEQKDALLELKEGMPVPRVRQSDKGSDRQLRALQELKGMGMLAVDDSSGASRLFLTQNGSSIVSWLRRC
jgi:hypothetical protein